MKLALIDCDGVIADDRHRLDFAIAKNWTRYFDPELMATDAVFTEGRELVRDLQEQGYVIAYLTGRRSALRDVTERWLAQNGFPWGRVIMREPIWLNNGILQDTPVWPIVRLADFKARIVRELLDLSDVEDVVLFEDDPEVVRTIQAEIGRDNAVLVPWAEKPEAMVKLATA